MMDWMTGHSSELGYEFRVRLGSGLDQWLGLKLGSKLGGGLGPKLGSKLEAR